MMAQYKRKTIANATLKLEIITISIVIIFVAIIIYVANYKIHQSFLDSSISDADTFSLFLSKTLDDAGDELEKISIRFHSQPNIKLKPSNFSNLYLLDQSLVIKKIIYNRDRNLLFQGFQFKEGQLANFLKNANEKATLLGAIRGYEDEQPSIYLAVSKAEKIFLARLDLTYIEKLLEGYSKFSSKPVLITTRSGVVMMNSTPSIEFAISPQRTPIKLNNGTTISYVDETDDWLILIQHHDELDLNFTILIPRTLIDNIAFNMWLLAFSIFLVLLLFLVLKYRQISALVIKPLNSLEVAITKITSNQTTGDKVLSEAIQFEEMIKLYDSFSIMSETIVKRAQALSNANEKLTKTLDQLPIAVAISSIDAYSFNSTINYVNSAFRNIFGYSQDEITTIEAWAEKAYPDPEYRQAVFERWLPAVADTQEYGTKSEPMEFKVQCADGKLRDILFEANVIDKLLVVTMLDLTERRQIEASLLDAQTALERTAYEVTENIPIGTYTMIQPPEGGMANFAFMSSRFLTLTGLKRADALEDPMKAFSCVHPDDMEEWVKLNQEAFEKKQRFYGETRVVIGSEVHWISAESIPRQLNDGSTVWEGVLIDITERREFEDQLRNEKARAEQLEKAKSTFLTNVSHEIRTPLTIILGAHDLLEPQIHDPHQKSLLRRINQSGKNLLNIINDILDLSKVESGRFYIKYTHFDLSDLVTNIRQAHSLLLSDTVHFDVKTEWLPDGLIMGDRLRIEQILNNLLSNAFKFTQTGNIVLLIKQAASHPLTNMVRFEVHDTGIGISKEDQLNLFTPFTQLHNSMQKITHGTGLGLSISKHMVELMGGKIGVTSELGKGSIFWFELPLQPAIVTSQKALLPIKTSESVVEENPLSGLTVLVVDDSDGIRELVQHMLIARGVTVLQAENGQIALDILRAKQEQIDAVLIDIQMPVIDGLSATREIRQNMKLVELPIIAMTAGLLSGQQKLAFEAGVDAIIAKPIALEKLYTCLIDTIFTAYDARLDEVSLNSRHFESPVVSDRSAFPEITGIDKKIAAQIMDNDLDMFLRLINRFLQEHSGITDILWQAIKAHDMTQVRHLAHKLSGNASQIGAIRLAKAAEAIELAIMDTESELFRLMSELGRASTEIGLEDTNTPQVDKKS